MRKDEATTAREDKRVTRCRRLGHEVTFHYCLTQEGHTVCPLILNCWWEVFDVVTFLREILTEEEFQALVQRRAAPPPRLQRIVEILSDLGK
jgi:hypothetical protein